MRIIEVRLDNEFRRAFDMDLFSGGTTSGGPGAQSVNPLRPSDASGPRAVAGLGNFDLDPSSTGIFQIINSRIRARLQLLEEKGRVHNLARPMVLASNNEPARLFIGEQVVMVTGATAQTTTAVNSPALTTVTAETEQRDIGTTLIVHPRINDDRTVTLTIDQENSRRIQGGTSIPLSIGSGQILDYPIDTMDTSQIQVAALAKDKLTIAVGGMIRAETSKSRQQIPGFGDIPVIGNLFSRDVETDDQRELVLLITPHILDNGEEGEQVSYRQISPAAEAQSRLLDPRRGAAADALPAPGAAPATPPAATPDGHSDGEDPAARYIRLTRHALFARRAPEEAARTAPAIAAQGVPQGPQQLWPEPGVQAVALEAWRDGELHATVVRLVNNSLRPIDIDPTRLRGRWLAATAERTRLAPLEAADSAMLMVLLSDRPFAQALEGGHP
jgi:general secretion pathway protein D